MTTIAAVHVPGKGTWFGSDTQVTRGNLRRDLRSPSGKWIVSEDGRWAIGYAGVFRTANIIEAEADALFDKLSGPFELGQRLIEVLNAYSFSVKVGEADDDEDSLVSRHATFDSTLLLVSRDGIWEIGHNFSVLDSGEIGAIGSGSCYALGAMQAQPTRKPADRLKIALETAIALDPYTGGNIVIGKL